MITPAAAPLEVAGLAGPESAAVGSFAAAALALALEISKGVIKNYKLRIYRTADVTSERALVRKFAST